MYSVWILPAILVAVFIWLLILSYFNLKQERAIRAFFSELPDRDLKKKISDLLNLNRKLADLEDLGKLNLQKVGFVRYNPYQDTGGDQSFSLCLLDARGDGVIISSLHSRSESRTFAKLVKKGQSDRKLSEEEEEALKKALS